MLIYYRQQVDHLVCFYLESSRSFSSAEEKLLHQVLELNLSNDLKSKVSEQHKLGTIFIEIGPKLEFTTPWCSQVLMLLQRCGLNPITRIERSRLYHKLPKYDLMTEMIYHQPLTSFYVNQTPTRTFLVNNIAEFNQTEKLGFDQFDLDLYQHIWSSSTEKRQVPTDVELYDLAQSNSEHSRHWLFRGKLKLPNGEILPHSLMDLIKLPLYQIQQQNKSDNSLIAMKDNSSAIRGYQVDYLSPDNDNHQFELKQKLLHPIFTAETHNFPTGIAPFPGAATGTGGRIRDIQAIGRGGLMIAGTAGYCVGNLEWEKKMSYPLHKPSKILIEASNGASDYGNKIGEPLIGGFCRSFGANLTTWSGDRSRIEWVKPIMFSGGIGQMMDQHLEKLPPEEGLLIVRLGGPAYRIGVGGGAASSRSQDVKQVVDFNAVQREDPEMENRLNKVIRTCIELGADNPILSIHDQGAGGMANVTKEIISPKGGIISLGNVHSGDPTLSAREKWIAEYQEQNTILIHPRNSSLLKNICQRENLPCQFVGIVTNSGRIQVYDPSIKLSDRKEFQINPVDLDLNQVLEEVPPKTFTLSDNLQQQVKPTSLHPNLLFLSTNLTDQLKAVFSLVSVGSKRFLTNKVDRSVTGLVVQQQCVGPLHTPISNVSVVAQSIHGLTGIASSIGEQPIKGLTNPAQMARLVVGEMLTNLVWAPISNFSDIKCSGNWMWEKKYPDQITALHTAVKSLSDILIQLGLAIDGGKDSLSMSAKVGSPPETVLSPRTLVLSSYVTCPDITRVVTPNLKQPGNTLLLIDLDVKGKMRLGGSALAQTQQEVGDQVPDLDDPIKLKKIFQVVQDLIRDDLIYAGHDRSDGGLITTLCEMAMAGNLGIRIELNLSDNDLVRWLFNEELGLVIEVSNSNLTQVVDHFNQIKVQPVILGHVTNDRRVKIINANSTMFNQSLGQLRAWWEATSLQMERLQTNISCVEAEERYLTNDQTNGPTYQLPSIKIRINSNQLNGSNSPQVAILREEGSNGDREMAAAFQLAGFTVVDMTTQDLMSGQINLSDFNGLAFVGGFSFADVLGAGRAWYLSLVNHPVVLKQLVEFKNRPDTFSLGVCNGCQLMAHLGWIPGTFVQNNSSRFESRWSTVKVLDNNNSIMLNGLAGMTLGIWVAHGEGKYQLKSPGEILMNSQKCMAFVDDQGDYTEEYPMNPNGSPAGLTGFCSADGRHLAMMPHPERSVMKWQTPWIPDQIKEQLVDNYYPWFEMFRNAYRWCSTNK